MKNDTDSKVYWAIMGPIWGRQDPGGPHVGPMNFAIWVNTNVKAVDDTRFPLWRKRLRNARFATWQILMPQIITTISRRNPLNQ